MANKNQILDMTPLGMIFTVLQTGKDTGGETQLSEKFKKAELRTAVLA